MEKSDFFGFVKGPVDFKIDVPRGTKPASDRCVDMVVKSMTAKSSASQAGYLAAAQWFALAAKP